MTKTHPKLKIKRTKLKIPKTEHSVFEIILRGLPFEEPMSVGVHITKVDLAFLLKNGRIIVDVNEIGDKRLINMKHLDKDKVLK